MPWTLQMDARLQWGADNGESFSQVAAALGVTRCAVSGRAHRLGVAFAKPEQAVQRNGGRDRSPAAVREIVLRRVAKGESCATAAAAWGLSANTVYRWKRGVA